MCSVMDGQPSKAELLKTDQQMKRSIQYYTLTRMCGLMNERNKLIDKKTDRHRYRRERGTDRQK